MRIKIGKKYIFDNTFIVKIVEKRYDEALAQILYFIDNDKIKSKLADGWYLRLRLRLDKGKLREFGKSDMLLLL